MSLKLLILVSLLLLFTLSVQSCQVFDSTQDYNFYSEPEITINCVQEINNQKCILMCDHGVINGFYSEIKAYLKLVNPETINSIEASIEVTELSHTNRSYGELCFKLSNQSNCITLIGPTQIIKAKFSSDLACLARKSHCGFEINITSSGIETISFDLFNWKLAIKHTTIPKPDQSLGNALIITILTLFILGVIIVVVIGIRWKYKHYYVPSDEIVYGEI